MDSLTKISRHIASSHMYWGRKPITGFMSIFDGIKKSDVVLDPFLGTGTTMLAAMRCGRNSIGYEIDPKFLRVAKERLLDEAPKLVGQAKVEVGSDMGTSENKDMVNL